MVKTRKGKMTKRVLAVLLSAAVGIGSMNTRVYAHTVPEGTETSITAEPAGDDVSAGEKTEPGWDGVTMEDIYEGKDFRVVFTLTGHWEGGYNASVKIENTADASIENWGLGMDYSGEISNIWNAKVSSHKEDYYVIKNAGWNEDIAAGKSVEFGFSGQENFPGFPKEYKLPGKPVLVSEGNYSVSYQVENDWGSGFSAAVSITNNSDTAIEDWVLKFDFDREITQIWNADIESCEKNHYVVKNAGHNSVIKAGKTVSFGFHGCGGTENDEPHAYSVHEYTVEAEDSEENSESDSGEENHYPDHEDWDSLKDTDGDGIPDDYEEEYGTDANNADTDGDGLKDGYEVFYSSTDPTTKYTDPESGIADGEWDFDEDGLNTLKEQELGTDCYVADTDSDLLTDGEEVQVYGTDPAKADTDGDTLLDGYEIQIGLDPLNPETFGYPDAEYRYEYAFDKDNPVLEQVNDKNEQYQMSFSVKGSGGAISEMLVRESAYANAVQQEYMLGCIPEILLLNDTSPEGIDSITLNFEINKKYIYDEYSSEELKGINRYQVFKFDEDENFLCPVNTTVDEEHHSIQADVDEIGTYCILDMELWLCEIGFEVDNPSGKNEMKDSMPVPMGLGSGNDGKRTAAEGGVLPESEPAADDIQSFSMERADEAEETSDREMVDIAFCINNNGQGLTTEEFQSIKKNIIQICGTMEYKSKSVRFHIIDQNGEVVRTSDGSNYAGNLTQMNTMISKLVNVRPHVKLINKQMNTLTSLEMRDNAFKVAVFLGNTYVNTESVSLIENVIEANIHCLGVERRIRYDTWYAILAARTEGKLLFNYNDFADGVLDYIYGFVPDVPNTAYHMITCLGLNTIVLKSELVCDGPTDTDGDGLTDWEEINQERVTVKEDGTVVLPTFSGYLETYYKEAWWYAGWSKRYRNLRNKDGVTLEQMLDEIYVLPVISDPASDDGDGDGILDADEYPGDDMLDEDGEPWDGHGTLLGKKAPVREDTVEKMYPKFKAGNAYQRLKMSYAPSYLTIRKNDVTMTLKVHFKGDVGIKARDVLSQNNPGIEHQVENNKIIKRLGKDCTLKDLAIDGIKSRWNGVYNGSRYDFNNGMKVNFSVKIIEEKKKSGRYIEVNLKSGKCGISGMGNVVWKSDCNRIVTIYNSYCSNHENKKSGECKAYKSDLYSLMYYEGVAAHEFGHVMGLADMYADAFYNHGYEPKRNAELDYKEEKKDNKDNENIFCVPSAKGIMRHNGSAVANDIEMILDAFDQNSRQYYVPYKDEQYVSIAIRSKPKYIKGKNIYEWNSHTHTMEEVKN